MVVVSFVVVLGSVVEFGGAFSTVRKIQKGHLHCRSMQATTTKKRSRFRSLSSILYSSPLEDPEDDTEFEEETIMVTKDPFESEAEIAEKANEMAGRDSNIDLQKELETSFLQYAMSIILAGPFQTFGTD